MKLVSIVIPAFNEAATLELFYTQLAEAMGALEDRVRFEFLFINNGSSDGTIDILERLRAKDPRVNILTFSRNFGYQAAITAGLTEAHGDAVGCVDSDGEDPPELLAKFIEIWLRGDAEVVYGLRANRPEGALMKLARKVYYRLTRIVADHEIVLDMAEFALLDRKVVDAVLTTNSTFPFVRGQVGYAGFRRVGVSYTRLERLGGKSHYNLLGATKFGLGGILSSSTMPLRMCAWVVLVLGPLAFGSVAYGLFELIAGDMRRAAIALIVPTVLSQLWIVVAVGVLGVYVARIYKDQVGLPLYVIDRDRSSARLQRPEAGEEE